MTDAPPSSAPVSRTGVLLMVVTLVIYTALALVRHSDTLIWDEDRYLAYATNLTQGFYVTDAKPDFVNGPGYPILLMPFVSGPKAWLWARLLNGVFMAGAVGFVWVTLRAYTGKLWSAAGALLTGLHPTLLWMGFSIMTEPLATFCLTGFVWAFTQALRIHRWSWKWVGIAALFLGWLILTRVFFGHVLMATSALCVGLWVCIKAWRPALLRALAIMAGALLICVPYLAYTQAKTGEFLCWSTNSGELLYWMTSHHEGENGHWFSTKDVQEHPELAPLHDAFYEQVMTQPVAQREEMFKATAMANLRANPKRVVYNWACNITRLAFGFPRSHQPEELRCIVLIMVNGPLIFMALVAGAVGLRFWKSVPVEIWLLMGFTAFYLGGSTLAPSLPRYFVPMVPVLWLGVAQVWSRHVRVSVTD